MNTHTDQAKQESCNPPCGFSAEPAHLTSDSENTAGGHDMSNEHEHDDAATAVLDRFHNCIERVTWLMVRTFEPHVEYEDAKAEASILVCVYAGLIPGRDSDYGTLEEVEADAEGCEERIQAIISKRLWKQLSELYGRQAAKRIPALDIDNLPQRLVQDDLDFESRTISQMLLHDEMRDRYPYLCRKYLDDVTEKEMSEADGTPLRTVEYRIAVERKKAATDPDVFNIVIPNVAAKVPLYASSRNADDVPTPEQVWAWHISGRCVECGAYLNPDTRVRETCSLECWNYARGRRTDAERKQWDYFFFYGLFDGDPRPDFPELYAYEGWTSWAPDNYTEIAA